jgi:hypothetical protein
MACALGYDPIAWFVLRFVKVAPRGLFDVSGFRNRLVFQLRRTRKLVRGPSHGRGDGAAPDVPGLRQQRPFEVQVLWRLRAGRLAQTTTSYSL